MRPTIDDGEPRRGWFAIDESEARPQRQTASTATNGSPAAGIRNSFRFFLSGKFSKFLLCFLYILEGQVPGLYHMRHDRFAAEQAEQFIDQPALSSLPRDHGLKDVGFADPLGATKSLLSLQPVDHCLHRGKGGPVPFRECLLQFADGARAARPERLHDLKFKSR